MPLSKADRDIQSAAFIVVGVRYDGSAVVLSEARTHGEAYREQQHLKSFLEGYAAIRVERSGEGEVQDDGRED